MVEMRWKVTGAVMMLVWVRQTGRLSCDGLRKLLWYASTGATADRFLLIVFTAVPGPCKHAVL